MKTLITASALILASNVALAESWEDAWQNPDLMTGVYDKPVTLVEPARSMGEQTVSLDVFNRGNPEHSAHDEAIEYAPGRDGDGFASSLDEFSVGNPDLV